MTSLVVGIVLIVGGIAFAAYPLLRRSSAEPETPAPPGDRGNDRRADAPPPAPDSLAVEREELDLDRAMGKLSDADYERLRAALDARARALSGTEALTPGGVTESPSSRDESIAEGSGTPAGAVAAAAAAGPTPLDASRDDLDAEAERLVRAERAKLVSCATCGPRPEPEARFCSTCGRAIGGCPACGATIRQAAARFCDQCGTALRG